MTDKAPGKSPAEIVQTIEDKDRKFRVAQAIFIGLILVILVLVVAVQFKTLSGVQEQLKQQGILLQEQKKNTEQIQATTAELSKQLDCIAKFFAQRNRSESSIADLEQCTIIRPDGSVVQSLMRAPDPAPETPAPATNSQPISPNMPGLTPLIPQQPETPEVPPVPDPVEILGIPLCVPFTGLCIR